MMVGPILTGSMAVDGALHGFRGLYDGIAGEWGTVFIAHRRSFRFEALNLSERDGGWRVFYHSAG